MKTNAMKKRAIFTVLLVLLVMIVSCTTPLRPRDYSRVFERAFAQLNIAEPTLRQVQQPLVMAHYMPWFQRYGFHWTQGGARFDPTHVFPDGRANLATHYYPLTGNYCTADPLVLEYHLALMKMAGIDGVLFDWYGITDGIDYRHIHESTIAMIELIRHRGMQYAIVYEDQSIRHLMDFGVIPRNTGLTVARETFEWMEENWFNDGHYVQVDGRPLVLCFGPQHFFQASEWDYIWSNLQARPFFVDLDARTAFADAAMPWSPMHLSGGGRLSISDLTTYLNNFYNGQQHRPFLVGTVFPGFHDIYAQAGRVSYGYLTYADGLTLQFTWEAAMRARSNVIQIQTWNDHGEGTVIEPTIERGYRSLEFFQDRRREFEPNFPFTHMDLRAPIELYRIMIDPETTDERRAQVTAIYDLIFAGDAVGFRQAMQDANIHFDMEVRPILFTPTEGPGPVVQIFDPDGRRNLALGRPAVASSHIDIHASPRATDGDISSYWEAMAGQWPSTLRVELAEQSNIDTIVIRLNPHRMWSRRVQHIEVRTGNDGQNWTTAVAETGFIFDPVENGNTVVIPLSANARFVQLVFTGNSGATGGQVAEIEIYGN
ncbi:MAG: discoidin domain-containing protein [Treponema sp.]|nr:discoidin domain-containing protein [Treponema sp.]